MVMPFLHHSSVRTKAPWRVLFFGTDEFSLRTLQALNENRLTAGRQICVVEHLDITHPRTKKMTPINRYAHSCDIMQFEWPLRFGKRKYDVGVLASFGHLIPLKVIEMFPYGIINVHPSLLPRWRGAAPIHHTLLNGDAVTGISIMSLLPKHFDAGPLLMQKEFLVPTNSTLSSLRDLLAPEGGKMIIEALTNLPQLQESQTEQCKEGVTYAHKLTQPMSFINWKSHTVKQIRQQYAAFHESLELRTIWEGTPTRLHDLIEDYINPSVTLDPSRIPGTPVYDKRLEIMWVKCQDGWLGFRNITIKKKMSAKSFNNGYLSKKYLKSAMFKSEENRLFNSEYDQWIQQQRPS